MLGLLLLLVLSACRQEAEAPPPASPAYPTPVTDQVALGRQVYTENCARCHGAEAEGATTWPTPDAAGRYPAPPHDDRGHTWHHPDQLLFDIIHDGFRDPLDSDAPVRMPAFGDRLSDDEIKAVIAYFKSLWSEENRKWQWQVTQQDSAR